MQKGAESLRKLVGTLLVSAPPRGRELSLAWIGLAVLGALAFIPHIRHGGFYLDDWSNAAGSLYPPDGSGLGSAIAYFADVTGYRPILVVYVPLKYHLFGTDASVHLALAAGLGVVIAAVLYGVLREAGVARVHSWVIAALTVVFPWYDSTRLWQTADQLSLALVFVLIGAWLAFVGLRRNSRAIHAAALVFYLLSILTYEIALPLVAVMGLFYTMVYGWRRARVRWGLDFALALAGAFWVALNTERESSGVSGALDHLRDIVSGGAELAGRTAIPVGEAQTTLALVVLAAILVLGIVAWIAREGVRPVREGERLGGLQGWLALAGAGLVTAMAGWAMFVPADPYYTPSVFGITNRVNALSGLGLVILVYATGGVLGTLLRRFIWRVGWVGLAVPLLIGLVLGLSFTKVLRRHSQIWDAAYVSERAALDKLEEELPRVPPETTILISGHPAYQTLGVPILSSTWDFDGMVKLAYEDKSLSGLPIILDQRVACRRDGVTIVGTGAPEVTVPYGRVVLFDAPSGSQARPAGPAACRRVADRYLPGPFYLSSAY